MASCWYCEDQPEDPGAAYEFKIYQHAPPSRSKTISVPRCEACAAIHGRINRYAKRIAAVFFLVPSLLCLLPFLLRSNFGWNLPWGVPVAIASGTAACIVLIPTLWERRLLKEGGTKYDSSARKSYPQAKTLLEDGWKLTEKVRRPPAVPRQAVKRRKQPPDRTSCEACGAQWGGVLLSDVMQQGIVHGAIQAGSSQYAGTCPECRKSYCARCARSRDSGLGVMISQCPDCGVDLLATLPE